MREPMLLYYFWISRLTDDRSPTLVEKITWHQKTRSIVVVPFPFLNQLITASPVDLMVLGILSISPVNFRYLVRL